METVIVIDNLKCGGCASTIKKNLQPFKNVEDVVVDPETDKVTITHQQAIDLGAIKDKLHSLGYPERDTTEGLDKLASSVKSYVSCAIGKLTKEEDKN